MPEDSEEKIEEIVDQKVEEKLHQKLAGEDTGDDYISQKIEEKLQELSETDEDPGSPIDRRSFLKALGLGAGGLALASPAASFLSLQNTAGGGSQTLSDVLSEGNDIGGTDIVDGGITVWDTSASQIPASQIQQGDGSGLDADSVDTQEPPFGAPSGTIAIWYGSISNIPSGWVLCDGNNSTPNLQDKFVVGAGSSYSVDGTGGSQTHTLSTSELASHNHDAINYGGGGPNGVNYVDTTGSDTSTLSPTTTTGGDSAHENRPPYHALAYIMKS